MITPWLLYAAALGALIGAAALGVERLVGVGRRPVRGVWLAALVAAVTLPIVADLWLARAPVVHTMRSTGAAAATSRFPLDTTLLALWAVVSLLLVLRMVAAIWNLRNRRREWREITVDGRRVLLTADTGPALVGLLQPQPVVPQWMLAFSRDERELMLRHEAEHACARDPWLLMAAAASIAAMPWNPALWWLSRRLRLAVEIDCDARVIRSGADPRAYASMLLAVGERLSRTPLAGATALAEPRSLLERRVTAMISSKSYRRPVLITAGLIAAVAGLVVIACDAPLPDQALPAGRTAAAPAVTSIRLVAYNPTKIADSLVGIALDSQLLAAHKHLRGQLSAKYVMDSAAVHADSVRAQSRGYQIEPLAGDPSHQKYMVDSVVAVKGVPLLLQPSKVAGGRP